MDMLRYLGAALMLVALAGSPSLAQPPNGETPETRNEFNGVRTTQSSNGFVLFEHGISASGKMANAISVGAEHSGEHSSSNRSTFSRFTHQNSWRRTIYLPQIAAAEARYALPTGLLDALVWIESRYNPLAISKAGAVGLGQLMPDTARALGITNRFDPGTNILAAARYLRQMLARFGMVHLAVAAYNAGPAAVERNGGIPINGETPEYVRRVLRSWRP